jgi:hypothetical protein
MTKTIAYNHYSAAVALRDRILDGKTNQTLVQAWASVVRECAKAESAYYAATEGHVHGRSDQSFLTNLDRVAWAARAQVETLARRAGA